MNDGNLVKQIEVRTNKGELLCTLKIKEVSIDSANETERENPGNNKSEGSTDDMMTFAQKRYIFRLLADQGIEGNEAYENLKERFKVVSLKDVTKVEASQVIEKLLEEQKGGDGHGSS